MPVLRRDRLVEAKLGAQLGDLLGGCARPERDARRSPGITRAIAKISIETPSRTMQEIPTRRTKIRSVGVTTQLYTAGRAGRQNARPAAERYSVISIRRNEKPKPSSPKAMAGSLSAGTLTRLDAAKTDCESCA